MRFRVRLRQRISGRHRDERSVDVVHGCDAIEQRARTLADGHDIARHVCSDVLPHEYVGRGTRESFEIDVDEMHGIIVLGCCLLPS
jgi:hypothetical protein